MANARKLIAIKKQKFTLEIHGVLQESIFGSAKLHTKLLRFYLFLDQQFVTTTVSFY